MVERIVPSFKAEFSPSEIDYVADATRTILQRGQLVLGPYTEEFEAAMADVAGTEYGVAVNSGSTALEIAYKTQDVRDRQVLIPTNTNYATAAAAVNAGARVEFYDSGLYPNVEDLEARLDENTGAVTVVHIGGYITPEMQRIVERCRLLGVPLIEDAAHAHGALLGGKTAGSFGDVSAFSFFPTKTLTTGEGGVLVTNDVTVDAAARQYRDQGKHADGITHEVWGNSWRMTEMGAALGLAQIASIERDTDHRAAFIDRYQTELADTGLGFPPGVIDSRPSGYKAIAFLPDGVDRGDFKRALRQRGVALGKEVYEKPLHLQPVFKDFQQPGDRLEQAEYFADRHICLPLWRFMNDEELNVVIGVVRDELAA